MMGLEAVLGHAGFRIAAWDRYVGNPTVVRIVAIESGRATVIARETVSPAERDELNRRMRDDGIVIGATYRVCGFVWALTEYQLGIWKLDNGVQAHCGGLVDNGSGRTGRACRDQDRPFVLRRS